MAAAISVKGHITEPVSHKTSKGAPMTVCRIAVEIPIVQKNESVTRWYNVIAFGSHAKTLALVPKGQAVCLSGSLEINRWKNDKGQQFDRQQITVDGLLCCASTHTDKSKAGFLDKHTDPSWREGL